MVVHSCIEVVLLWLLLRGGVTPLKKGGVTPLKKGGVTPLKKGGSATESMCRQDRQVKCCGGGELLTVVYYRSRRQRTYIFENLLFSKKKLVELSPPGPRNDAALILSVEYHT